VDNTPRPHANARDSTRGPGRKLVPPHTRGSVSLSNRRGQARVTVGVAYDSTYRHKSLVLETGG
jgi:hypothetical protein